MTHRIRRPLLLGAAVAVAAAAIAVAVLAWPSGGGTRDAATYGTVPTCAGVQAKNPRLPRLTTRYRRAPHGQNQVLLCLAPSVVVQIDLDRGDAYTAGGGPCPSGSDGPACARAEFTNLTPGLSPHPLAGLAGASRAAYGVWPHCWAMAVRKNASFYLQYDAISDLGQCRAKASAVLPGLLRTLGP